MALIRFGRSKKIVALEPNAIDEGEKRVITDFFRAIGTPAGPRAGIAALPFSVDDATAGTENELQTAVAGSRFAVDLPLTIEQSNYYANLVKRVARDGNGRAQSELTRFLQDNDRQVWEHSQVRVPAQALNAFARQVLRQDLHADKKNPAAGVRADLEQFVAITRGKKYVRVPVSYLLKLALADALGEDDRCAPLVRRTGLRLLNHFLNDNTSPEQIAAYVAPLRADTGMGRAVAKENAIRFLLTQLLTAYANTKLRLREHGQEVLVYFSALPPQRLRRLNDCVSDTFYRDLFMNPCLSGWDRGEAKRDYMHLCHKVLSRSQVNAIPKLRDAGIIRRNLVIVPNLSNTSLANNGTHLSLGSLRLGRAFAADSDGAYRAGEKYVGDLAIKMVEHFLPLFVGTYSAAPHRVDFADFHPEKMLSFLPHELDGSHLRMVWVSWKKKARIAFFKHPITPFGVGPLDRALATGLRLRGDAQPDFRLLDYFVSLQSTDQSPALDGQLGNGERLKRDLAELGVFDTKMTTYLPYRLREFAQMGFSGFEGRYYSVFEGFESDLGRAADMQLLVTALAYKYMANGLYGHAAIPDDPVIESERRQMFFAAAIGLPFCYVRRDTNNRFLLRILARADRVRTSKYYRGYFKVPLAEYRLALLATLEEDAADLIEMMQLGDTIADARRRLLTPAETSAGRQTRAILAALGARSPLHVPAADFNRAAEDYYRERLRKEHLREGLRFLLRDAADLDREHDAELRAALRETLDGRTAADVVARAQTGAVEGALAPAQLTTLIQLVLLAIARDARAAGRHTGILHEASEAPVYRTHNG